MLARLAILVCFSAIPVYHFFADRNAGTWQDVFEDYGVTYFLADRLAAGDSLYSDIAYPYGPLPVWIWTAFTCIFGNTPATYAAFTLIGNLIFAFLLYAAIARVSTPLAALVVVACGLVIPETEPPYRLFERCIFAGILLAWVLPEERSFRHALVVGLLLGLWQWVKFGGAVYAAGSLVVVDLVLMASGRASVRLWLATTATAAALAGLIEVGRIAWASVTLTPDVAADVIWPAYTKQLYDAFGNSYPGWHGWRHFAGFYLIPVSGLVATIAAVPLARRSAAALFIPTVFFLLGIGTYLGHSFIYTVYIWCLMPPVAALLARWPWTVAMFILIWFPGNAVHLRDEVAPKDPGIIEVLPQNHPVAWDGPYREAYHAISGELERSHPGSRPLIMPVGNGFYFLRGLEPPSRHCWLQPHYFRPYDEDTFIANLDRIPFIAYVGPIQDGDDMESLLGPVFGEKVMREIRSRSQEEISVNLVCLILRLN